MTCRDCELIEADILLTEAAELYWAAIELDAYENKYAAQTSQAALNIEWAECCSEET